MRQFSALLAILALWAFYFGAEASSLLACTYGPENSAVLQNQFFIERIDDSDTCLRRVDCTRDLEIKISECKNLPCPPDAKLNKREFPDCCC